jgi:hypothetical protein
MRRVFSLLIRPKIGFKTPAYLKASPAQAVPNSNEGARLPTFKETRHSETPSVPNRPEPDTHNLSLAPLTGGLDSGGQITPAPVSSGELKEPHVPSVMTAAAPLLTITQELHAIETAIVDAGGEISSEIEERLSAATIAREQKVDAYAAILVRANSIAEEYQAQAERFASVAKGAKALGQRLKENLKYAMVVLGAKELNGERARFQLRGAKDSLKILDIEAVDAAYFKPVTKLELDREALMNDVRLDPEAFKDIARIETGSALYTMPPKSKKEIR